MANGKSLITDVRKLHPLAKGLKKISEKSTIRGIENTMDVYISRCAESVTSDIISKYIEDETKIKVINCSGLSHENSEVQSFKVTVPSGDRDALLDGSLWPENVLVRKFFKKN